MLRQTRVRKDVWLAREALVGDLARGTSAQTHRKKLLRKRPLGSSACAQVGHTPMHMVRCLCGVGHMHPSESTTYPRLVTQGLEGALAVGGPLLRERELYESGTVRR